MISANRFHRLFGVRKPVEKADRIIENSGQSFCYETLSAVFMPKNEYRISLHSPSTIGITFFSMKSTRSNILGLKVPVTPTEIPFSGSA